ncbi:GerW family sporulation protein [Nocardia sp. NPDC004582]
MDLENVDGSSTRLMEELVDRLSEKARASVIFGDPITSAGVTIVPVARAGFAFGVAPGRGSDADEVTGGGGSGGGMEMRPLGFIEIRDGSAHYRPLPARWTGVALPLAGIAAGLLAPSVLRAGRRLYRARRG